MYDLNVNCFQQDFKNDLNSNLVPICILSTLSFIKLGYIYSYKSVCRVVYPYKKYIIVLKLQKTIND